jgi:fused signal recognition particle receptor
VVLDDPAARLPQRLGRTRSLFSRLRRRGTLDEEAWDDLEETLLLADVGLAMTATLLERVRSRAAHERLSDAAQLPDALQAEIAALLDDGRDRSLRFRPGVTNVWLLVGVNGVGKTTTVAKLAARAVADGHSVLLAAADTFRAAAGAQLDPWAQHLGVEIVRGQEGGDPGAVAFDATASAHARGIELVLIDTAGRLHTKVNLMAELEKIRRVVQRTPDVLQEVLLVLDASTGQNGLAQAREFTDAVGVTGVVLTKLDGTAKGGIVLAIEAELGVPVKLVGIGEAPDDLVSFVPGDFAAALVGAASV